MSETARSGESERVVNHAPSVDAGFWSGRRVFLTGHTGFKGAWLSAWLSDLGAQVKGYALDPDTTPNLFDSLDLAQRVRDVRADVRDRERLARELRSFEPEVVFHLAAQALVRRSYREPVETFETNVMGTVSLLEAVRACPSVRVVVNITTDKVYENREWSWGYRENDALGGHDPYSSSKACAEIVSSAYRRSFLRAAGVAVATARAGNVIGGGDWSKDRLIPDIVRSFMQGHSVPIRNPLATRPWQHVLEPLYGYLVLAQACWDKPERFSQAWNFGPRDEGVRQVRYVVDNMVQLWGEGASWQDESDPEAVHEAKLLKLDTSKARQQLGWEPRVGLDQALAWTIAWYQLFYQNASAERLMALMREQRSVYRAP